MSRKQNWQVFAKTLTEVGASLGPNQWWARYLFHFTDVKNAAQILSSGSLLSRNAAIDEGTMLNDNASPEVIAQTADRWKDYVRFYFRPKTPTQYRNEGFLPPEQRYLHAHCPVPVFFLFDAVSLLSLPESEFSDMTLASPYAMTFTDAEDFTRLQFDYVYHEGRYDKNGPNIANYRQAEVVIPTECSLEHLKRIVCRSAAEKQTLLELLDTATFFEWIDRIAVDNRLYYANGTYVERANLSQDTISFTFHTGQNPVFDVSLEIVDPAGNSYGRLVKQQYRLGPTWRVNLTRLQNLGSYQAELRLDGDLAFKGEYLNEEMPF
ncbi:DUF4433 domain-containing protein [Alicyclobacillus curvatus]|nr:DUF4433 domain-containing protein [Alicyclobacillus curvatus]